MNERIRSWLIRLFGEPQRAREPQDPVLHSPVLMRANMMNDMLHHINTDPSLNDEQKEAARRMIYQDWLDRKI